MAWLKMGIKSGNCIWSLEKNNNNGINNGLKKHKTQGDLTQALEQLKLNWKQVKNGKSLNTRRDEKEAVLSKIHFLIPKFIYRKAWTIVWSPGQKLMTLHN